MTAPSGVITRIWHIDLNVAERFLAAEKQPERGVSGTNRKHSDELVNEYAFEMLSTYVDKDGKIRSRWGFSHQGFAFIGFLADGTAELKDGGHRCRALIQACTKGATLNGKTLDPNPGFGFDVMVTEGLDEDSWRIMDINRRRTPGDFMVQEGEVNGYLMASIIQLAWLYENYTPGTPYLREYWGKSKLSPTARQEYLNANPGLREAMAEGSSLTKVMTVSAASAGFFLALKAGVDKQALTDFMDSLHEGTGANWVKGNPVLKLREMLLNAKTGKRRLVREEQLALFIKALNAYIAGTPMFHLSYKTKPSSTGAAAEVFPRIVP